jgi:protein-S-isoprenylcysteine O-methyltransferase Ste14
MDGDQLFRIALIVGTLMVLPMMAYHRLKAQAAREKLDRWREGPSILFTSRPLGVAAMLGLPAFMINPGWMAWSSLRLPEWLRWAGVVVGVLAGGLLIWTLRTLGPNLTDTVITRKEHRLVTSGPYRWVRHPFYDAVGLAILANTMTAANWFHFVTGGLVS